MNQMIDRWQIKEGEWVEMRRMLASDQALVKSSLNKLSTPSRRNRFFATIAEFSDDTVRRLVDVDPLRAYPLVVLMPIDGVPTAIAGGRFVEQTGGEDCTFSLLTSEPWQRQGIGRRVLQALLSEAARRGLKRMYGEVLADNQAMLRLAHRSHFVVNSDEKDGVLQIVIDLPKNATKRPRGLVQRLLHG